MSSGATSFPGRPRRRQIVTAAMCLLSLLSARPALAQLTVGSGVGTGFVGRGVDAAHDPANDVFLVLHSTFTVVRGVFVNSSGVAVGSAFDISSAGRYSNFSRARYSPHVNNGAGGFLVTWSSEDAANKVNVRTRVVSYPNGPVGADNLVGVGAWLESAPALAYSNTSKQFLVVWGGLPTIRGTLVDLNGAATGAVVSLSTNYGRDPGVTWNPARDEFGVSFNGETATGVYSALAVVPAANPAQFTRSTFNVIAGGRSFITDVDFSPEAGRYVMGWCDGLNTMTAEFDQAGTFLSAGVASFNSCTADSLGIAFNPVTKTFLGVGINPQTDEVKAFELIGRARNGTEVAGGIRALYPRAAASQKAPGWLISATTPGTWAGRTLPIQSSTVPRVEAPGAATLSSPEGAIATAQPTYKWNAVSAASYYRLYVVDSSTRAKIDIWYKAAEVACGGGTGTCSITPGVSLANGAGKWWIQTWNAAGFGPWSLVKSFDLTAPPGTATLTSPLGTIHYSSPSFSWNAVSDATYYRLWVQDASGKRIDQWFTAEQASCSAGTGACAVWPDLAMASGPGSWWIQTWSPTGKYGAWSAEGKFNLQGATLIGAKVVGSYVQFSWNRVPGATHYLLFVDNGKSTQEWFNASDLCNATQCGVQTLAPSTGSWWILTWGSTWPSGGYGTWSAGSRY